MVYIRDGVIDGIVEKDGTIYLYTNGRTGAYGLTEYEGDYYEEPDDCDYEVGYDPYAGCYTDDC